MLPNAAFHPAPFIDSHQLSYCAAETKNLRWLHILELA